MMMKCFVMWQPWASLVVIGAKPLEFRPNDYRKMGVKVGQRVAFSAGARPVKPADVQDLLNRLDDETGSTGLIVEKARPFLMRLRDDAQPFMSGREPFTIPMASIIATVTLGEPKPTEDAMPKWKPFINDSDRLEHAKWAWPMLDVKPLAMPVPVRGFQRFFNVSLNEDAV